LRCSQRVDGDHAPCLAAAPARASAAAPALGSAAAKISIVIALEKACGERMCDRGRLIWAHCGPSPSKWRARCLLTHSMSYRDPPLRSKSSIRLKGTVTGSPSSETPRESGALGRPWKSLPIQMLPTGPSSSRAAPGHLPSRRRIASTRSTSEAVCQGLQDHIGENAAARGLRFLARRSRSAWVLSQKRQDPSDEGDHQERVGEEGQG
jgi:hypothetical protein